MPLDHGSVIRANSIVVKAYIFIVISWDKPRGSIASGSRDMKFGFVYVQKLLVWFLVIRSRCIVD